MEYRYIEEDGYVNKYIFLIDSAERAYDNPEVMQWLLDHVGIWWDGGRNSAHEIIGFHHHKHALLFKLQWG